MPKYIVERELAGIGNITPDQVITISQKSCSVLDRLGPKIQWLQSYVTTDKIYCVYIAADENIIRTHATQEASPPTVSRKSSWSWIGLQQKALSQNVVRRSGVSLSKCTDEAIMR